MTAPFILRCWLLAADPIISPRLRGGEQHFVLCSLHSMPFWQ